MKAIGKFFAKIAKFFREIKVELKKVVWPTWDQIKNNTVVVLACVIFIGIIIWVLDAVFGWGVKQIISK
jgi:preprotein translocase, secE subunit